MVVLFFRQALDEYLYNELDIRDPKTLDDSIDMAFKLDKRNVRRGITLITFQKRSTDTITINIISTILNTTTSHLNTIIINSSRILNIRELIVLTIIRTIIKITIKIIRIIIKIIRTRGQSNKINKEMIQCNVTNVVELDTSRDSVPAKFTQ